MNTRRVVIITALVIALLTLFVAAFGKRGMFALYTLSQKKDKLTENIEHLQKENEALKQELLLLKRSDYQETVIRTRMGMAKEGETIYIFTSE